ncbi:Gfo/Idh/MocA family oxidoreductase [Desulfosporosinus sp. Sb-LF]|nr:Gfo/Idh/MocA family oxidoreductase [Desulfosporosinus sp. Sb-LF]TGE33790.1 Gfo/Idh/MocA family oxidoreductase [Desulfosporosinus sp. Sb-LF]
MRIINIGVLGGADIAYRMFLPALLENPTYQCGGVASLSTEKRKSFAKNFNVPVFDSYDELLESPQVDAVYIPLPPALHYQWAKNALEKGKHVFVEKPSTVSYKQSAELVTIASKNGLVLQENYMFQYHSQMAAIRNMLKDGKIGDIRLLRAHFGFPLRTKNDFRYNDALGGGALLDAGGYVVKLATLLLGNTIQVRAAKTNHLADYNVDMFGNATFENSAGLVLQGAFGMDCYYQCNLEAFGSSGKLYTNRIFTAPSGLQPVVTIETAEGKTEIKLPADNHFRRSIELFGQATKDEELQKEMAQALMLQAKLVETIRDHAEREI